MKKMTINKVSGESITVLDEDDTDILDYSKQASSIMEASNVTLVETSEKILIVRPHSIESIEVSEIKVDKEKGEEIEDDEDIKEVEEHIDIITDGE